MTHRTLFPPPDEKRALEQLERLHREIQRARGARERAGAEFEGVVQEARTEAGGAARESPEGFAPRRLQRPAAPTTPPVAAAVVSPAESRVPAAAAPARPVKPELFEAAAPAPRQSGIRRRFILPVAATVLIGGLAFVYFWQRTHAPAPPAPTASTQPVVPPQPETAPRPAPQPPPAPVVSPSTVQLTTTRPVWLRVIVDGERVLERELPAGQQLTYTPANSIVMRAGDAGALRVKVGNGPEETLGRDAFPATRRINVRPSTDEPR